MTQLFRVIMMDNRRTVIGSSGIPEKVFSLDQHFFSKTIGDFIAQILSRTVRDDIKIYNKISPYEQNQYYAVSY